MSKQRQTPHTVRIDFAGDPQPLVEALHRVFGNIELTIGRAAILFVLPPGIDTIVVANFTGQVDPQVKEAIKRITMFEDSEEAEAAA